MITARIKADLSGLNRLERNVPGNVRGSVREAANALARDIHSSWSDNSPSSPFEPPAVLTGNLDSSVVVDDTGRDEKGRFTSNENAIMHFVRVDTTKGDAYHGRGGYETYLEDGTSRMDARPFFEPAVERLRGVYPQFFTNIFKSVPMGEGEDE